MECFGKKMVLFVLLLGVIACVGSAASAEIIVIDGADDVDDLQMRYSWAIWGSYGLNFVGEQNGESTQYRIVLKFDVAGDPQLSGVSSALIDKAEVKIYAKRSYTDVQGGQQYDFDLHRLRRDFKEGDFVQADPNPSKIPYDYFRATGPVVGGYKTFTDADKWTVGNADSTVSDRYAAVDASFTGPATTSLEWITIDVTQYVKDVLDGASDYGWVMKADVEGTIDEPLTHYTKIQFDSADGTNGPKMEVTVIPEPATVGLLCAGGLLALMRKKNR